MWIATIIGGNTIEVNMFKKQFLLILLIIFWSQHSSCFVDDFLKIAKKAGKFLGYASKIRSTKGLIVDFVTFFTGDDADKLREISDQLKSIETKIDNLESYSKIRFDAIEAILIALPDEIEIRDRTSRIVSFIVKTNEKWNSLLTYLKDGADRLTYLDLAQGIAFSIEQEIAVFRNEITPEAMFTKSNNGYWSLIAKHELERRNTLCNAGETFHQTLVRLYQMIMIADLRAYVLISLAKCIQLARPEVWKLPVQAIEQNFRRQYLRYLHALTQALQNPERPYLRACDPKPWRRDVNFIELEGLFQQTVYGHGRCKSPYNIFYKLRCQPGHTVYVSGNTCCLEKLTSHAECQDGELTNCQDLLPSLDICLWEQGPHRIRYLQNKEGLFGTDTVNTCPAKNLYIDHSALYKVPTYHSCMCYTPKWKIVAKLTYSELPDNNVVVGMRLYKENNYIFIQIAEGKLEFNGYISSFSWVPPTRNLGIYNETTDGVFSVERHSVFFFDDIVVPTGYVLTGVQFLREDRDGIEGFSFAIHGTKFDYATGKLDPKHQTFQHSRIRPNKELEYSARSPINIHPTEKRTPSSGGYTHIRFKQSSLDHDYGQSTLPLFDTVPIMTSPLSPMGGVGFFRKSFGDDAAGFLSLRLFPIEYLYYIQNVLDKNDFNSESTWSD